MRPGTNKIKFDTRFEAMENEMIKRAEAKPFTKGERGKEAKSLRSEKEEHHICGIEDACHAKPLASTLGKAGPSWSSTCCAMCNDVLVYIHKYIYTYICIYIYVQDVYTKSQFKILLGNRCVSLQYLFCFRMDIEHVLPTATRDVHRNMLYEEKCGGRWCCRRRGSRSPASAAAAAAAATTS